MKGQKSDRRIQYTKMILKKALVALLQKKPISKITIKEICETADINRSTFYVHYGDQYDLLRQIVQKVLLELKHYLDEFIFKGDEKRSTQIMVRIFEYIVENAELCKVLLGENGDVSLQKEIMMIVQRQSMKEWQGTMPLDAEAMEYMLLFGVNGGIGVVQKWLQDGLKKTPGEMAELLIKLTYQGIGSLL